MGIYLNGKRAYGLFQEDCALTYYVDKTHILDELVPILEQKKGRIEKEGSNKGKGLKYICITRPRRFGKTMMANMIASYLGKGVDSSEEFAHLKASRYEWYKEHLNRHNVIQITFTEMPNEITNFEQYIARVKRLLITDLKTAYPDAEVENDDSAWDALTKVYEYCDGEKFVFVLDEWDYIYHQKFVSQENKDAFTKFLSTLLKDQPYVEMVYMTGILPISKYSSGSELNMFFEFTMATMEKYSEYFGFTEEEVDELYQRYIKLEENPKVSRSGLRLWYNGYQTMSGKRLYNPRGYVDYIFYPYKKEDDGIIIELKVDDTAESAVRQIKDRKYALNFDGKLGEEPKCTGRILAVGIAYDRKDENKRHECRVEVLRERLE